MEQATEQVGTTIAQRILFRLDILGKNPPSVALEAGLGRSSVRDILTGKVTSTRLDTLQKLTGPLECSLEYLTGSEGRTVCSAVSLSPSIECVLRIAASQWTSVPTPEQIIMALNAGGFKIVSLGSCAEEPNLLRSLANDKLTTGRRIAATRKAKGLSQEKIAEIMGCHTVTVSKLETGEMDLSMEWILRFADALEVAPTRFTEDKDVIHNPIAYVQDVLERHNLSAHQLATKTGLAASTLTRAFNDPNHKFIFSTRTLQKIKEWDQSQ